jgi:hypothetical protein
MLKIRLCAALWAVTTVVLALLLFRNPAADLALPVLLVIAALCLAVVAPFDATRRPARMRVAAACGIHVLVLLAALGWAVVQGSPFGMIALLAIFVLLGGFLFAWAWTTRARTHRSGWGGYYDRPQ